MLRRLYPILFFVLVALLCFWKVIFNREFTLLIGGDVSSAYFPWFDVAAYWLKKGVFLLWDPYVYSGKPFMGEPQPGLFYPLNWIFMLLPARGGGMSFDGMQALMILDYLLISFFFYLLARSFNLTPWSAAVAGVAFAYGGFTASISGYVNIMGGFVWMPLSILCCRRALLDPTWRKRLHWILWSGICLALTFLPGHHIPLIHAGLFLFSYTAFLIVRDWRQSRWKAQFDRIAILASVPLTAAFITALQWLPSVEWARQVYRWIGSGPPPIQWGQKVPYSALQVAGNLHPQDVLSLLFPYLSMGANLYVGCTVVFLALVGLLFVRQSEARFFSLMVFVYLLISWGWFSALHGWVNTFIPGAWFAREVFHYLIPFHACLAMLAGFGLDHLVEAHTSSSDKTFDVFVRRSGWGMAIIIVISWVVIASLRLHDKVPLDHPYVTAVATFAVYLTMLGVLLFLVHSRRIQPSTFRTLVLALVVLDLSSLISRTTPGKDQPPEELSTFVRNRWKKQPWAEYIKEKRSQEGEFFRVDDPAALFPPNYGDVWRIDAAMGHGATALVKYFSLRGAGWGPASNASALLNIRYFTSSAQVLGMEKVYPSEGDVAVYLNPRAVPRAFVARRFRTFPSEEEMLKWIINPLLSPRETVLLFEQDFTELPESFRKLARGENGGIKVRVARHTAGEKAAEKTTDEKLRHKLYLFQPPWGWSPGDEVRLQLIPERPLLHCYLIINFYPTSRNPSILSLKLEGPRRQGEIAVELPGLQDGEPRAELPRQSAIDLGLLDDAEYLLSFVRTEACSAYLDSLRISESGPDDEAGTVTITSYTPHRIGLRAELRRPSFVVLSEVFYSGWEATVDGHPAPLLCGDYILRTVPVPEGKHEIELRFRSRTFRWGLIITLMSLSGIAALLLVTRG